MDDCWDRQRTELDAVRIAKGTDVQGFVVEKLIYVGSVVDGDLENCIFAAFHIRLCELAGHLMAKIARTQTSSTVASWLCLKFPTKMSMYCKFLLLGVLTSSWTGVERGVAVFEGVLCSAGLSAVT